MVANQSLQLLFRLIVIAVLPMTLCALSGCKPAADTKIAENVNASAKSPDTASSTAAAKDLESKSDLEPKSNVKSDAVAVEEQPVSKDKANPVSAKDGTFVIKGDLAEVDWSSLVGENITIEGDLVVADTFDLARRGRVNVARKRLYVPTSQVDPNDAEPGANSFEGGSNVAKVVARQKSNESGMLTIDDNSSDQNVFPPALFPELGGKHPTVRIGSVVNGVSGKLVESRNKLLLMADGPLNWTPAPRPERPNVGDADITVASFNVLNYFTTIDNGKNRARGSDSDSELVRQEAKIVSAITALNADVIGLMELENNLDAEKRLVAALNTEAGSEVYKGCGVPSGFRGAPGGEDAIRVGIIYRADRVKPVGDVSMINDNAFFVARTPIVQTFESADGGKPFALVVNHFKSKGGASDAEPANKNKGDGQGAYNAARRSQALAISKYVDKLKASDSQSRVLVIGDLNAYQQEDPVDALRAKGLVDLHERFSSASEHYSYVYFGQCGSLDHAFASASLAKDITGIAAWHINSDEPKFLDYNQEYNPKSLYKSDPYRSSDHDPVIIGIRN